ncbi:MAG: hypothetical protein MJB57_03660 [Gemmatimonadetes bacterium]|nr:hypothetical protein [Gemmatimonadota bacterium]
MPPEHPLSRVERDLRVTPRRRLELLEEVRADAEALEAELVRRGRGRGPARDAAIRQVVPEGEALASLEAQHAPVLRRWAEASGWGDRLERVAISAVAVTVGAFAIWAFHWPAELETRALLAWSQALVVALLAANWTQCAVRLWVMGDLREAERRALWRRQIGLVVAGVALGALGAAWEVHAALGDAWSRAVAGDPTAAPLVWGYVKRATASGMLGLVAATFGLFGWLALTPRLITDEVIERRIARLFTRAPTLSVVPDTTTKEE